MGKDNGLDQKAGNKAMEQVEAWRRMGQLPFPSASAEQIKGINNTLNYPPKGSPEAAPRSRKPLENLVSKSLTKGAGAKVRRLPVASSCST